MEPAKTVSLQCLFCRSEKFELPEENYQPKSGDMIKCANCGRLNDYDSMMRVIKRKAREFAEEHAKKLVKDFSKDIKKIFK